MKIFQIEGNICYWDATHQFPTLESTVGYFPPSVIFVEAPDEVFEGWGYIDGEFVPPIPPEGWVYDNKTGTFYIEGNDPPSEVKTLLDVLKNIFDDG